MRLCYKAVWSKKVKLCKKKKKKNEVCGTYRCEVYNLKLKQTIKTESACFLDEDAIDKFSEKYEYDSESLYP